MQCKILKKSWAIYEGFTNYTAHRWWKIEFTTSLLNHDQMSKMGTAKNAVETLLGPFSHQILPLESTCLNLTENRTLSVGKRKPVWRARRCGRDIVTDLVHGKIMFVIKPSKSGLFAHMACLIRYHNVVEIAFSCWLVIILLFPVISR